MNTLTVSTLKLPALHHQPLSLADLPPADWIWVVHKLHKPNVLQPRTFSFFSYQPRARHNVKHWRRTHKTPAPSSRNGQCGHVSAGSARALNRGCCDGQCCRLGGEAQPPGVCPAPLDCYTLAALGAHSLAPSLPSPAQTLSDLVQSGLPHTCSSAPSAPGPGSKAPWTSPE